MDTTKGLYHPTIMEHNQNPYHYGKKEGSNIILKAYNPLCGDQFTLYVDVEGNRINQIHFHGYGCAVSKASTSLLAKDLEGKYLNEARVRVKMFIDMLKGPEADLPMALMNTDLAVFAVARQFPARLSCASLSWEELNKAWKNSESYHERL